MVKILFLDIDGVLNSDRSAVGLGNFPHSLIGDQRKLFDEVALGLIRQVCKETSARIVLSSTWRLDYSPGEIARALALPVISSTPIVRGTTRTVGAIEIDIPARRGEEIKIWMEKNGQPDKYAIVDDDSDMLPEQKPYFVQTTTEEGLLFSHYRALLDILGREVVE